jgi:hypothetical protein
VCQSVEEQIAISRYVSARHASLESILEEAAVVASEVELAVTVDSQVRFGEMQAMLLDMQDKYGRLSLMNIEYRNLIRRDSLHVPNNNKQKRNS